MAIELFSKEGLESLVQRSEREGHTSPVQFTREIGISVYPLFDFVTKESSPSVIIHTICKRHSGSGDPHVVCLAYYEDDLGNEGFIPWCGDAYLEGKLEASVAKTRVSNMLKQLSTTIPEKRIEIRAEVSELFNSYPRSGGCDFWPKWREKRVLCAHTTQFVKHLVETSEGQEILDQARAKFAGLRDRVPQEPVKGLVTVQNLAFKVPLLLEGDRGSGKTKEVRDFCRTQGHILVEQGGHEGVEAPDLLGYVTPLPQGGYVWKDGPITQAFRKAKSNKVVLLLDELLRIRQRELSLLLTALSPDNGVYRIRTGRVLHVTEEGVGEEEVLECPVENLCVVATTNVGSEYAVDEIDPAVAERFFVLRKDTTKEALTSILIEVARKKSFSAAAATKLITFFEKMTKLQANGICKWAPTTRTMVRAIELADTEEDIPEVLAGMALLWVARDSQGKPISEQVSAVHDAIRIAF